MFPQMSLVYKSGVPEVDPSKVRIDIPADDPGAPAEDILKDLQKGGPAQQPDAPKGGAPKAKELTPEEKAAAEIEKALGGK